MDGWMDGWLVGWMDGYSHENMQGRYSDYGWMNIWMEG